MKKISILIIGILYCFTAMSQQISMSDIVSIKLPKGIEKLTKEKFRSTVMSSAQRSAIDTKIGKGDFYKLNRGLMVLYSIQGITPKNYLEQAANGLKAMSSLSGDLPPNYKSEIKAINNYRVLVVQYDSESLHVYRFFAVNNTHTNSLNGIMEFNISEKDKETAILDEMLKSIKFK